MKHIKRWTDGEVLYGHDTVTDIRTVLLAALKSRADLSMAYLSGAIGIDPDIVTPLRILRAQVGPVRAYKLTNVNGEGPYNGGIVYSIGAELAVADPNTDECSECGSGINLATLSWCLTNIGDAGPNPRIFVCEFLAADIAAIPHATDGKFRVRRCRVIGELDLATRELKP